MFAPGDLSPLAIHSIALVLTLAVGLGDAISADIAVSPFYLVPVLSVAWLRGRGPAFVWSGVAVLVALAAARSAPVPSLPAHDYWSTLIQLGLLAGGVVVIDSLRASLADLRALAGTDHLTGVLDGRSFQELVELERNRALRYNRPFTLAYLDIDRLRGVNELRGHTTGDRTLHLVAQTVRENIRSMDSVARLAGDEFALLFPETGPGAAEVALGKIRMQLDEVARERDLPITFSMGAVICVGAPDSVDRLIQRADALMYRVKDNGGDGLAVEVLDDAYGIEAILQRS